LHILHRIFLHFQAQQLFFESSSDNHHHNLDCRVSTWKMQTIRNLLGMAVDCIHGLPILHQHILFVECRQHQRKVHEAMLEALILIVSRLHMIGCKASMLNMAPIDKPVDKALRYSFVIR